MKPKKYELTQETREFEGRTLHRVRALRDIGKEVKCGDLGGWVESEDNLSHGGNAWVSGNACVYGNARVREEALVFGTAKVFGNADVRGTAQVYGDAKVFGQASVSGGAEVYESALVYDRAVLYGCAIVRGYAQVYRDATVSDHALVTGHSQVYGEATVGEYARVYGGEVYDTAYVRGFAHLEMDAWVYGDACLNGNAFLSTGARVESDCDYITVGNMMCPEKRDITVYRSADGIVVAGPTTPAPMALNDFERRVMSKCSDTTVGECAAIIALARIRFGIATEKGGE